MENITYKKNLSIVEYCAIVDALARDFFDEDGNYIPHIGKINAMRVFYNECVTESKFDIEHNIVDAVEMEPLVSDKDFMAAFNEAIQEDFVLGCELNFANAYDDALDIVRTKKESFANIAELIRKALAHFAEKMAPVVDGLDLDKLMQIADKVSSGEVTADAIVSAYADSIGNK